ncbi:MAG TPA: HAD-IC family P-type ATPase [Gemmatimonadaceae bacterium]|nr:HAD-IC family P-type ATPase [Gemmatimonadaceae bacterium]
MDETLRALETDRSGLSDAVARRRLRATGPNTLRVAKPRAAWRILLDQLRSVVVLLLIAAAAISFLIADPVEAAAIAAVLAINTLLGFSIEIRARRAMEALLHLDVPRATVIRAGRVREIDARELVPGDVIRVEPGQAVPADARVIEAADLRVDEAPLTGESLPVDKGTEPVADSTPLPDRRNMLYKGTTILAGTGSAVVVATGMATEVGLIGGMVGRIPDERTPLERRLDVLGRRLIWLALAAGALVTALGALRGMPLSDMVRTGIALAIAAVPEGLPAVSTIALAVGVHRMARRHALVRRLPSVETLGSVTVICTDKTGTLTAGEMTVTVILVAGREIAISGTGYVPEGTFTAAGEAATLADDPHLELALRIGMLANRAGLEHGPDGWTINGDPTEAALLVAGRKACLREDSLRAEWPQVAELPFSSERMLMATFNRALDGAIVAHAKGAPSRILDRCARALTSRGEVPLDDRTREELEESNRALAARGLRVLALASGPVPGTDDLEPRELTFVGLVGMLDPPATGVRETIQTFRDAGIRTMMLTGDQRLTADAVARDLGIVSSGDEVVDGQELAGWSPSELARRIDRLGACSRVSPEHKLAIVAALQDQGAIVAMLGDGVNDAAALKKADVGVAMGRRGTDVAKETAAVVLQDDRFRTIGAAVEEGRIIFDNIRKFVFYLFSCNLAEVMVLVGAGVVGLPLPLAPLQILWLNLVTDTFPALALAFEPGEADVMRRPPRDPERAILSAPFLRAIGVYAVLITIPTLTAFVWGLTTHPGSYRYAVTLSFMTLAFAQLFHLGNARSREHVLAGSRATANPYALGAVVLVIGLQLLAVYAPPLAAVLGTEPPSAADWGVVVLLALVPAIVGQARKRWRETPVSSQSAGR